LRQRDELRDKLFSNQAVKTYSGGKPNYTQPDEAMMKRVMDGIPDMPIKVSSDDFERAFYRDWEAGKVKRVFEPEPTIDGWPLYSGLPPSIPAIKVQDKTFEEFAQSFAQSARVNGIPEPEPEPVAYINVEKRELEWATPVRWETPTVAKMDKVPLYAAPQKYAPSENNLAYERGYIDGQQKQIELAVHKAVRRVSERDWHELTDNEIAAIKSKYGFGVNIFSFTSAVRELETWLKERNSTSERSIQISDNKSAESS
jgi:hypothetical protein